MKSAARGVGLLARRVAGVLPRPVETLVVRSHAVVMCVLGGRIPIFTLSGARGSQKLTMAVAGEEPWVNYLPGCFFESPPQRQRLGSAPAWQLEAALSRLAGDVDLTVARVDRFTSRRLFGADYLRVPEWISTGLPAPEDLWRAVRANHSVREDMRLIRREKMAASISHDLSDFASFHASYYLPFTLRRHPELAVLTPPWLLRRWFQAGGLIWVSRAGQRVAGMLFEQDNDVLRLRAEGTLNGDTEIMKTGGISALYFGALQYGRQRGLSYLDFGGCRAVLTDGLLRYKRKWGMRVTGKPDNHYHFLVRWNKWNTAVAQFFSQVPVIYENDGGLTALCAVVADSPARQADVAGTCRLLWMTGLDRLRIISSSGWEPGGAAPPGAVLSGAPASANELR